MKRYLIFSLSVWLMALLTACGGGEGITVTDAWIRPSPTMNGAGAVYMVLENDSAMEDRLLSVSSDRATIAELHESKEMEGMMAMSPVEAILVPGNGRTELKPGGYHIMLMGIEGTLEAGQHMELTLQFERAGEVTVTAEVREE